MGRSAVPRPSQRPKAVFTEDCDEFSRPSGTAGGVPGAEIRIRIRIRIRSGEPLRGACIGIALIGLDWPAEVRAESAPRSSETSRKLMTDTVRFNRR